MIKVGAHIKSRLQGKEVQIFRCPATVKGFKGAKGCIPSHCSDLSGWEGAHNRMPESQETLGWIETTLPYEV